MRVIAIIIIIITLIVSISITLLVSIMLPQVTLAGFGPHSRHLGLYTKENDNYYVQYLRLTRPAQDVRALGKRHGHCPCAISVVHTPLLRICI